MTNIETSSKAGAMHMAMNRFNALSLISINSFSFVKNKRWKKVPPPHIGDYELLGNCCTDFFYCSDHICLPLGYCLIPCSQGVDGSKQNSGCADKINAFNCRS